MPKLCPSSSMARLPFFSRTLDTGNFYPHLSLSPGVHPSITLSSLFLLKRLPRAPTSGLPIRSLSANGASHSNGALVRNFGHVNKQVISVTPQLYDYILANVREPEVSRLAFVGLSKHFDLPIF